MTIICGLREENVGTWIGGDTLVAYEPAGIAGFTNKWIMGDGLAIGICGPLVCLDATAAAIHQFRPNWSAMTIWLHATDSWKAAGVMPKVEPGEAPEYPAGLIFATPTRLLSFCSTGGAIVHSPGRILALGSGSDAAEGAAYVLLDEPNPIPGSVVARVIDAAKALDRKCGGDTWVTCLKEVE